MQYAHQYCWNYHTSLLGFGFGKKKCRSWAPFSVLWNECHLIMFRGQLAPTPMDILCPGKVFCGKLRSVYVVKCVWSSLTDLLFNRLVFLVRICDKLVSAPGGTTFLKIFYWQQCSRLFFACDRWFNLFTNTH